MSVSLRVSVLVVFLVRQRRKHSRLIEALDHPADAVSNSAFLRNLHLAHLPTETC